MLVVKILGLLFFVAFFVCLMVDLKKIKNK